MMSPEISATSLAWKLNICIGTVAAAITVTILMLLAEIMTV
jgi:hypothetical protein